MLSKPDSSDTFQVIRGSGFPDALQMNVTRFPSAIVSFGEMSVIIGATGKSVN